MFRLVAALLICGMFFVVAPMVRAAQPAAVQDDRFCIPFGLNTTLCSWVKLVQHTSTQPDGDQSIVYHTDQGYEISGPMGVEESMSTSEDIHFVTVEGLLQELHDRSVVNVVVLEFSCKIETFYHYANGQVQIDRVEDTCV